MVRDNQLGIMGSETLWKNISFKKNAYLQAIPFTTLILFILFIGEYKKTIKYINKLNILSMLSSFM